MTAPFCHPELETWMLLDRVNSGVNSMSNIADRDNGGGMIWLLGGVVEGLLAMQQNNLAGVG
jgi:hypothetical protein